MSEPFLGEIRMFGGNFAPRGWAFCAGQLLPISQNTALFSILGTTYGGNGQTTFALPDLRGRAPVNSGQGPGLSNYDLGQQGGAETVTLISTEIAAHTHPFSPPSSSSAQNTTLTDPINAYPGAPGTPTYANATDGAMAPGNTGPAGGSQPHQNLPPYLCVSFIIALEGIFPSRN
jgi:microcystin-dependent protein